MTNKLVASTIVNGRLFRLLIALGTPTVTVNKIEDVNSQQLVAMQDDLSRITEAEKDFATVISLVAKPLFRRLCNEELAAKFPDNVLVELSVSNTKKGGT